MKSNFTKQIYNDEDNENKKDKKEEGEQVPQNKEDLNGM